MSPLQQAAAVDPSVLDPETGRPVGISYDEDNNRWSDASGNLWAPPSDPSSGDQWYNQTEANKNSLDATGVWAKRLGIQDPAGFTARANSGRLTQQDISAIGRLSSVAPQMDASGRVTNAIDFWSNAVAKGQDNANASNKGSFLGINMDPGIADIFTLGSAYLGGGYGMADSASLAEQTALARQGLQGAGELSELPALTGGTGAAGSTGAAGGAAASGAGGLEQYGQTLDPYNGSAEWPNDSVPYNSNQPIETIQSPSITEEFGGPSSSMGPQPQIDMPDLSTVTQPELSLPEVNIAGSGLSPLQLASLGTTGASLLNGAGGDPSGGGPTGGAPTGGGGYDPSNPYGTGPTSTQWPDDSVHTTDTPQNNNGNGIWDSIKNAGGDFEKLVKDYPTVSKLIGSAGLGGLAAFSNYQQAQNNQKMQQDAIARQQARQQVMDNPAPFAPMQGPGVKPFVSNGAAPTDLAHYGQGPEFNFSRPQQHAGGGRINGSAGAPMGGLNTMRLVKGPGGGQDDKVPAMLSPSEYVFDAETVSHIGDGNPEEGARKLDQFRERLRAHKRSASAKKIPPKARPIDSYMRAA